MVPRSSVCTLIIFSRLYSEQNWPCGFIEAEGMPRYCFSAGSLSIFVPMAYNTFQKIFLATPLYLSTSRTKGRGGVMMTAQQMFYCTIEFC